MAMRLAIGALGMTAALVWQLAFAHNDETVHSTHWTDRYDELFRKYAKRYFGPQYDWRWFKAQAIAESGLRHDATSPAGARGVMQILPSTFAEIRKTNPHFVDIDTPRWNIGAAIFYDRKMYQKWKQAHAGDRLYFAFASYNAGYRRIANAATHASEDPKRWHEVRRRAPGQTRHYVRRIRGLMQDMPDNAPAKRKHSAAPAEAAGRRGGPL